MKRGGPKHTTVVKTPSCGDLMQHLQRKAMEAIAFDKLEKSIKHIVQH